MSRPSGHPIVDDAAAAVTVDIAEIEKRGRLNILPRWRKRVVWINAVGEADVDALMIFVEPGLISIDRWEPAGPEIQQRFTDLSNSSDPEAPQALRLIQDRYQRLVIPRRERPSLGAYALAHLGLPFRGGHQSLVYVSIFANRIDIMAPPYRDTKLIEGNPLIDDLP